jgi:purine nucleosidase
VIAIELAADQASSSARRTGRLDGRLDAVKVLLDTDIGSDIDDAMCLTYLLAQPECELLGITTVSGEAVARAALASAICKQFGRDVPIRAGLDEPLRATQLQPEAPQKTALARWDHDADFEKGAAIDFLADQVRAHSGEVVLLSIGPLTNVAALFMAHPDVPERLGSLMMMAGAFRSGAGQGRWNEWNVRCDPHAAAAVYAADVRVHRSVGLNVSTRVQLPADEVRGRCAGEHWAPALDMAEVWFRERPSLLFHDPLAAAALFDDGIPEWNRGRISVCTDEPERGRTTLSLEEAGPHEAASFVDAERFFEHFFSVTG